MSWLKVKHLAVCCAMLAAAGLALAMTPTKKIADLSDKFDLNVLVPKTFADWHVDTTVIPVEPSPDLKEVIDKLYQQTLSRSYVNSHGDRVMLSIAYGGDQSRSMQVHKPEVCYTVQGFQIVKEAIGDMASRFGSIPVKRLVAIMGPRNEPITYWITTGDKVTRDGLAWRLTQLRYGLTGTIPDGLLFRVSTISKDDKVSYAIQDKFSNDLLAALDSKGRSRLIGALSTQPTE
jgi:EpsI family protein